MGTLTQKWKTSWTIFWGHIQTVGGMFITGAALFTPQAFPTVPAWVFGTVGIISGVVTYWLRKRTTKPLDIA